MFMFGIISGRNRQLLQCT